MQLADALIIAATTTIRAGIIRSIIVAVVVNLLIRLPQEYNKYGLHI